MLDPTLIEVSDDSSVGEVRRVAGGIAIRCGLDEDAVARLSIIATELATNLIKHASRGLVLAGRSEAGHETIEVLALDHGPGIGNVAEALRDGHSTTRTSGTGLGAVSRLADFFQLYSTKQGTTVLARIATRRDETPTAAIAGVSVPVRGEALNGDGWYSVSSDGVRSVMVVDGLGHGALAHDAAVAACHAFARTSGTPAFRLRTIHEALQHTRGAAVAVAELKPDEGLMLFAGVGNISATMIDPAARRSAVSLHGIVGHALRDIREFTYPWSRESCLIMHSDGLTTRWDLDRYPALITRDPALIAGVLWKDHRRPNDDSTVVVARTP